MSRPETITSEYVRGFRAGESSALERAAQIALSYCRCPKDGKSPTPCMTYTAIADGIRALASPAAAPATEPDPILPAEMPPATAHPAFKRAYAGMMAQARALRAPPSGPVAPPLLPRVLAAIESHPGEAEFGLAAELRRYIADQPAAGAPEESPK